MLLVFFLSSRVKLSAQRITPHNLLHYIFENLPREFSARICRGYLLQKFAMGVCRGYLPWVFCICKQILFCISEQILLIWKQTFSICEQNLFISEIFFISTNSVFFCYRCGSYGPPYKWMWISLKKSFKFIIFQVIMFSQNVTNLTHF